MPDILLDTEEFCCNFLTLNVEGAQEKNKEDRIMLLFFPLQFECVGC